MTKYTLRVTQNAEKLPFEVLRGDVEIAAFKEEADASSFKCRKERSDSISCCKASSSSHGWRHDTDCENWTLTY